MDISKSGANMAEFEKKIRYSLYLKKSKVMYETLKHDTDVTSTHTISALSVAEPTHTLILHHCSDHNVNLV